MKISHLLPFLLLNEDRPPPTISSSRPPHTWPGRHLPYTIGSTGLSPIHYGNNGKPNQPKKITPANECLVKPNQSTPMTGCKQVMSLLTRVRNSLSSWMILLTKWSKFSPTSRLNKEEDGPGESKVATLITIMNTMLSGVDGVWRCY